MQLAAGQFAHKVPLAGWLAVSQQQCVIGWFTCSKTCFVNKTVTQQDQVLCVGYHHQARERATVCMYICHFGPYAHQSLGCNLFAMLVM